MAGDRFRSNPLGRMDCGGGRRARLLSTVNRAAQPVRLQISGYCTSSTRKIESGRRSCQMGRSFDHWTACWREDRWVAAELAAREISMLSPELATRLRREIAEHGLDRAAKYIVKSAAEAIAVAQNLFETIIVVSPYGPIFLPCPLYLSSAFPNPVAR